MLRTDRTRSALCVGAVVSLVTSAAVHPGEPPEIAHVFPEYPGVSPQLITGERFDPSQTEIWIWEPPSGERIVREATVLLTAGRGLGQYRRVSDNSATSLTVDPPWNVTPNATTEYAVAPQFVENAFFANLNNTPCRMSLWLDCIANQVDRHRDDHAKGTDLWGEDASAVNERGLGTGLSKFFPAWYNVFLNGWMDGTALWLGTPGAHPNNAHRGFPSFGNYVVGNRIRSSHQWRTGFNFVRPTAEAGITVGGGSGRAGTSHTIVADKFVGAHDWMVSNGYCGHRRGVTILYADGSVRWSRPFSTEAWNKNAPQAWVGWARE